MGLSSVVCLFDLNDSFGFSPCRNIELALIYHKAQELEKKLYQPETTVTLDADTNSLLNLILRSNFLAKKKEKHISELNDLLQGDGT